VTMSLLIMFSLMVIADFIINQVISIHKNKLSKV
ncbi:PAP2 family protein, partial [Staphylococcus capitis]